MTTSEIKEIFLSRFTKQGFERIAPMSMLSRAFPTNFTPSGGEEPLADILCGKLPHKSVCTIQPCFRYQDIFPEGSRVHLPYFHMAVAISVDDRSIHDLVREHLALFDSLGLDRSKLRVSVFGGGLVHGERMPLDTVAQAAWMANGVREEQFDLLDAEQNFLLADSEGYAGTKTEAFYPWNGQMLELSVIVRLTHHMSNNALAASYERKVICGGIGLERLALLTSGMQDIIHCTETSQAIDVNVDADELKCLLLVHALEMLYRDGASLKDASEARSRTLKRLIKHLLSRMEEPASRVTGRLTELLGTGQLSAEARARLLTDVVHVAKHYSRRAA